MAKLKVTHLCSVKEYTAIGVMSGSSLDGIDLALCRFRVNGGEWTFNILDARTDPYPDDLRARLLGAMDGSSLELARLHRDLGDRIGNACKPMLGNTSVDVIASHGHTIFHKPSEGLTTQIGCGARIAAITGTPTVCDLRTTDMALGGQGAPLVPLGESLLFPDHPIFLNIGGICNVSLHRSGKVTGYDVCIGNQALNFLAEEAGAVFDKGGALARSGLVNNELLQRLNALPFHTMEPPRSLGREWFKEQFRPLITSKDIPLVDRMRTVVEHIAFQVGVALEDVEGEILTTGGGAHNTALIEALRSATSKVIRIPEDRIVDLKEALIFALLGVLHLRGEPTARASVTGALRDSCGGALYRPN